MWNLPSVCVCVCVCVCVTLCSPMDCIPPGSSVHGIFQARILEWVAMSSSRGSPPPRDQSLACCIFTTSATWEAAESSWTRDQTPVPCISGQILIRCTTREGWAATTLLNLFACLLPVISSHTYPN